MIGRALMFAGWLSAPLRSWVADIVATEEAELQLKAVTGDNFEHYAALATELRLAFERMSIESPRRSLNQAEALEVITTLVSYGYEPESVEDVYRMDMERMARGWFG